MKAGGKIIVGLLMLPLGLAFIYSYSQRKPEKLRFYFEDNLESDVWRVPIIEPYQLITTDGVNNHQAGYSRWTFQEPDFQEYFHPDSINYQPGFITFHDTSQHSYGFCDITHKSINYCNDYQQFRKLAITKGLSKFLYSTEMVYEGWSQTRLLPWAKDILMQRWGLTNKNN
ncbi:hypothetical protein [Hymenobacter psoromatis]|uniref:hypothetical protein n=1 Tax=Hymenobacter psoromatis TaxID=1484116 RepID=UPI001CC18C8B|nr:hypothetical protein [Hymenobacter psoromatis]